MANEIVIPYGVVGKTVYVHLRNATGQAINGTTAEAYNQANWTAYSIAATEQGASGVYAASMPAVAAGAYKAVAYEQQSVAPVVGDAAYMVYEDEIEWDGTARVPLSSRLATSGYTVPPSAATIGAQITSDHGSGSYVRNTEPDNATISAINAKTTNLPSDPASESLLETAIDAIPAATATAVGAPTAVQIRQEIDSNSTQLAALVAVTAEQLGLLGKYTGLRNFTYNDDGNPLTYDICVYDSSGNATTNDGSTGLVHKYSVTNTYSGKDIDSSVTVKVS